MNNESCLSRAAECPTRRTVLASMAACMAAGPVVLIAGPAWALTLGEAKASGKVGELGNGFIAAVGNQNAEVAALVDAINAKRRKAFAEIAKANGTTRPAVEAVAGAKLIQRAAPGHFIRNAAGQWVKK